jgi:hypothetical protein
MLNVGSPPGLQKAVATYDQRRCGTFIYKALLHLRGSLKGLLSTQFITSWHILSYPENLTFNISKRN